MLRLTPLLLLAACGIFGMSEEDRTALTRYQSNAKLYWDWGNFDQALDQARRGLEIDPDDYNLRAIQAWCWLRAGRDDAVMLDRAVQAFDEIAGLRADADHAAYARLGYAEAHTVAGLRALTESQDLRAEAERMAAESARHAERINRAATLRATALQHFALAEGQLERLVELGDQVRRAHFGLMQIEWWRDDYNKAVEHGHAFLARARQEQTAVQRQIHDTMEVEFEREKRRELQALIDDEVRVRAYLANLHFKRDHHELVVAQLDEALGRVPGLTHEYYNRARSLLELGRTDEAVRDLQHFLPKVPLDSPQAREALRILREHGASTTPGGGG